MENDNRNRQRLKDQFNNGLITFDQYTEGLVQLLVSITLSNTCIVNFGLR